MTAVHTSIRRHRLGLLLLSAVFTLLMALSIATPSRAFAAEAVPTCNPTATNGCVNGILQDADKKPIANVELKLSGQEEATTTTDAEGKWAFSVNADGKYTVTMDESVAKDHGLKPPPPKSKFRKTVSTRLVRWFASTSPPRRHPPAAHPVPVRRPRPVPAHPAPHLRAMMVPQPAPISASVFGSSCFPVSSSA